MATMFWTKGAGGIWKLFVVIFISSLFLSGPGYAEADKKDLLTPQERAWLNEHTGKIRYAPSPNYPPIGFIDKNGTYKGVTADYLRLLENALNFKFEMVYCKTWSEMMQKARQGEVDMIGNIQETPARSAYLSFTRPYIVISNVIIVRKDVKKRLSLELMKGMKVAVVKGYASIDYIRDQQKEIIFEQVADNPAGLQMVSFGRADAMITDLAVASYFIDQLGINNLKVAGEIGFVWKLTFASRKELTMLNPILKKGLASIGEKERIAIHERWIHLGGQDRVDWIWVGGAFLAGLLAAGAFFLWNLSLKRQVKRRTSQLEAEFTERTKAEEALQYQARLLREMGRIAKIGGWEFEPASGKGTWTDEVARIHDLDPAAEMNLEIGLSFYGGASRAKIRKAIQEAAQFGKPYDLELDLVTAKGIHKWVRTIGQPKIENGKVVQVRGAFQDITEHKLADQRIEHLNRVLRAVRDVNQLIVHTQDRETLIQEGCRLLVENRGYASALILLTDENDRLVSWARAGIAASSEALKRMLERFELPPCCTRAGSGAEVFLIENRQEICGTCPLTAECCKMHSLWVALVHEGTFLGYLVVALDKDLSVDDEERFLFAELAGDLSYAINVMQVDEARKASERKSKSLEAQLLQAQKMESIGRLAGGVAHDFNNKLNVIIGCAELALEKIDADNQDNQDDPLRADLQEILTAANRSADITRQLLAFARQQTIAPKVLELNETVEKMFTMLRRLIGEEIDIAWLPGTKLWPVKIDPVQIDQILVNLCVNAQDAITGVGRITIETENVNIDEVYCADHVECAPGDYVLLTISDDGCGIDPETLNRIFEPFFTTKAIEEGTGLGLATVYGIAKQNNGFVGVYSEPGKGSTFKVYLPRHMGPVADARDETVAEIPLGRGETVLLVEDEASILKIGKRILGSLGYTVLTASTPSQALALTEQHMGKIDLLITDVIMPEINGRDLADQLQVKYPNLKVLFMSGYAANVIAEHGVLEEGVCFIPKPFTKKDMAVKVRAALDDAGT